MHTQKGRLAETRAT